MIPVCTEQTVMSSLRPSGCCDVDLFLDDLCAESCFYRTKFRVVKKNKEEPSNRKMLLLPGNCLSGVLDHIMTKCFSISSTTVGLDERSSAAVRLHTH